MEDELEIETDGEVYLQDAQTDQLSGLSASSEPVLSSELSSTPPKKNKGGRPKGSRNKWTDEKNIVFWPDGTVKRYIHSSRLSQKEVVEAIDKSHGIRPLICAELSCSPRELATVLEKYPRLRHECQQARTQLVDVAEVCLLDLLGARRDEIRLKAVELILKNLGEDGQWMKAAAAQIMQNISVQSDEEKKVAVQNLFGVS